MKLLIWHVEYLKYKDTRYSNRPKGVTSFPMSKSDSTFRNVIMVLTCIEEEDVDEYVLLAIQEIMAIKNLVKSNDHVVIVPFAHLSSKLAKSDRALSIIDDLANQLKNNNLNVEVTSFGYHKDFELHYKGYGHPGSVAFRSIPR